MAILSDDELREKDLEEARKMIDENDLIPPGPCCIVRGFMNGDPRDYEYHDYIKMTKGTVPC